MKLLIIDSLQKNKITLKKQLESVGLEVDINTSKIDFDLYNLIIIDIDDCKLLTKLLPNLDLRKHKVIITSDKKEDELFAFELGASDFVLRSGDFYVLLARVKTLTKSWRKI